MSSINKVILIGRIGQNPEIKKFDNNQVANFSLATSEKYKDKDGNNQEKTEWHNVSIWGKLSVIVDKYCKKGDLIYLEGKLQTRSYEKDGQKKYMTEVIGYNLQMLGSKPKQEKEEDLPESEMPEWLRD